MRISKFLAFAVLLAASTFTIDQPDLLTLPPHPSVVAAPRGPASMPRPLFITPSAAPLDLRRYMQVGTPSSRNGAYGGLPPQLHTTPGSTPSEQPLIQRMSNMYQLYRQDADLFDANGRSMLCGAAAMANALMFLRVNRVPPIDDIARTSMSPDGSKDELLRMVFDRCHVSRDKGSTDRQLRDCASDFLAEGGYIKEGMWAQSVWDKPGAASRVAPRLGPLRDAVRFNRVAVLLFGWYVANPEPATGSWTYVRTGGHFVTLAGFDRVDEARIYISNPLIDYDALGLPAASAIVMEPVPANIVFAKVSDAPADDLNTARGQKWQTRDLTAQRIGVLESVIIIGPTPHTGALAKLQ